MRIIESQREHEVSEKRSVFQVMFSGNLAADCGQPGHP